MFDLPIALLLVSVMVGLRGALAIAVWVVAISLAFIVLTVRDDDGFPSAIVLRRRVPRW